MLTSAACAALMAFGTPAFAQVSSRAESGLQVREVSIGTGYGSVQLPPITLGGYLPSDILNADLISTAQGILGWNVVRRDSGFFLNADSSYTNRARYSEMSAFGGSVSAGASHLFARRLQTHIGATSSISSSDQLAFQTTETQDLVNASGSFDSLSHSVAYPKSRNPNPSQAAWFVPIRESLLLSTADYGHRTFSNGVSGGMSYSQSSRLVVYLDGSYTSSDALGSSREPGTATTLPFSQATIISAGTSYSTSRRTAVTASVYRARSVGMFNSESTAAELGFGWTGRRWFADVGSGIAYKPFPAGTTVPVADADTPVSGTRVPLTVRSYTAIYRAHVGFKSNTQTFVAGGGQAPNDSQGVGSLSGPTLSLSGSWFWSPARSKWGTQINFEGFRVPGNFLYIFSFQGNASIHRQLTERMRLSGEFLWDRHGSKGFEGFHLTREGAMVNVTWFPRKRLL